MGALGHYIEREGVPTGQISLIREQTAAIKPPRALWVPFMLGRPFGVPNDPAFQHRVLARLLALFERPRGIVLEDFPEEAPADPADAQGYACPVSFGRAPAAASDMVAQIKAEIAQLATWHELARSRRGRSTVGISGMPIAEAAQLVGKWSSGAPTANPQPDVPMGTVLKRACDDLKAYYFEALGAQPGNLSAQAIDHAFWHDTVAARAFIALRGVGMAHEDKSVRVFAERSLVPRAITETMAARG